MISYVELLNSALTSIGQPEILGNPFLSIDSKFSFDKFTMVVSESSNNSIPFVIELSESGIDVHINGSSEVFSWGKEYIENNSDKIIEQFCILLTSNIIVESYGKNYKKFIFENSITRIVRDEIKVFDGMIFNPFSKKTTLFLAKFKDQSLKSMGSP